MANCKSQRTIDDLYECNEYIRRMVPNYKTKRQRND